MFNFPKTEKQLKNRISSYKSALNKEKRIHHFINDGAGKRYLLFSFYLVLNDLKKSAAYFKWYEKEFPDDVGEPIQKLCWAISLYRMGKDLESKCKLAELMLSNLYMIPRILGQDISEYDMWHSSNYNLMEYCDYIPDEVLKNIQDSEKQWMQDLYDSFEFRRFKKRYVNIYHALRDTKDIDSRTQLLDESYSLLDQLGCENGH